MRATERRRRRFLFVETNTRNFGGRRKAVCDSARKTGTVVQGTPRDGGVHAHEAETGSDPMERKHKLMSGFPREIRENLLEEVLVLEDMISAENLSCSRKGETWRRS